MIASLLETFSLTNKVAVVTGAAMGIGERIAERLADAGASVALLDVDIERADRVAESIRAHGGVARAFRCDVARVADIDRSVESIVGAFGHIDVLVNNAGVFPMRNALELDEATWDRVLAINLKGAFFMSQRCARTMNGRGGSIVNIASIDGLHPTGQLVHYDASKGGMIMMTRSLALELAPHGIRVNAVAPGAIHTPGADATMATMSGGAAAASAVRDQFASRVPLGRMGEPDDIASAVLFFAGRAAAYVTGTSLVVDGGLLLR